MVGYACVYCFDFVYLLVLLCLFVFGVLFFLLFLVIVIVVLFVYFLLGGDTSIYYMNCMICLSLLSRNDKSFSFLLRIN